MTSHQGRWTGVLSLAIVALFLVGIANASAGDRSAEFKECLRVCAPTFGGVIFYVFAANVRSS